MPHFVQICSTAHRECSAAVDKVLHLMWGGGVGLQELQHHVEHEASSAKTERKKRETAERLCRQAVEDKVRCSATKHSSGLLFLFKQQHFNNMSFRLQT